MLRFQLFVLSILQILDVLTTHRGLGLGGTELNPLARAAMDIPWGFVAAKIICTILVALILWYLNKEYPELWWALVAIMMLVIGVMAAVVTMNALGILFMTGRL